MSMPFGMVVVSKKAFYKALESDLRDIMPSVSNPYETRWETKSRELWGWMSTGWKSPWDEKDICAVYPQALDKSNK